MTAKFLVALALAIFLNPCFGEDQKCPAGPNITNSEEELLKCLTQGYSDSVRPVDDPSKTVLVNVSFFMVAVAQVYDKDNAVSLDAYVEQSWHDHRLTWDPAKYGGINRVFLPYWHVWEPEMTIFDNRDSTGSIVEGRKVVLRHTGEVEWFTQMRFSTYCWMDHNRFPFDEQTCHFYFGQEVYDSSLVNISIIYPTKNQETDDKYLLHSCYSVHSEWNVKGCHFEFHTYAWENMTSSTISLEITMVRAYSYHYYLIIIPSILIVLFTLSLLWLPHESNQRFAAAGGILFVLLLTNFVLQQFLPPGIGEVPVIASYLVYAIILLMMIIIISLITFNLQMKDARIEPVPDLVKKIFFNFVIGKATFVTITPFISMENASVENKTWNEPAQRAGDALSSGAVGGDHRTSPFGANTEKLLEDIRRNLTILANPVSKVMNEWKQLSLIIDRLTFYILFFLNIIISTALFAH